MLLGAHLRETQAHWFRRHRYFNLAAAPYQSVCRCPRALPRGGTQGRNRVAAITSRSGFPGVARFFRARHLR
jgi:hypothetical protein